MASLDHAIARSRLSEARVGRLGTVTTSGRPHLVPCCFAVVEQTVVSAVDGKPKSTGQLRRLDNIRARPAASLLVDHYDDDWMQLWWVRVDGSARVIGGEGEQGSVASEYDTAIDALAAKYAQYREHRPTGALVVIDIDHLTGWSFVEGPPRPSAR